MRQFLTMAFLGVTLAFGASPALAYGDKIDYVPPHGQGKIVSASSGTVIRTESRTSALAGADGTTASVYRQQREDNRER